MPMPTMYDVEYTNLQVSIFLFQNKTQDQTIFDTGGNARTRGSRWGIQGSYYFGN